MLTYKVYTKDIILNLNASFKPTIKKGNPILLAQDALQIFQLIRKGI